jgi:hypothetical protein
MVNDDKRHAKLLLQRPPDEEDEKWILDRTEMYANTTAWLAMFVERRASMGDMSYEEVMGEIGQNIALWITAGRDKKDDDTGEVETCLH